MYVCTHACCIIAEWLQRAQEARHFKEILEAKAGKLIKCEGVPLGVRLESKAAAEEAGKAAGIRVRLQDLSRAAAVR